MIKVDIFSGFLGAGKTTLIKKLIKEAYVGEKVVLIENEFGEIGIDGGFMREAGIEITEMNSGCICCSLVGDFGEALKKVIVEIAPDRILIEPSGVGKLSDVIKAVMNVETDDVKLNAFTTVVDATKFKMYTKNFGEFFNNQIENASSVVISHIATVSQEKLEDTVEHIRELNKTAVVISTDWDELTGKQILDAMENKDSLVEELKRLAAESADHDALEHEHHHHHHDDDDEDEHEHHHEHHHDEDEEHEHHHEHHHDEDEEHEHHHEHHHDEDEEHEHHHEHHHEHGHHHADEIFDSWGIETPKLFDKEEIENKLSRFDSDQSFGMILRAKGIVKSKDGKWIHFDYIPGKVDVRYGTAEITGRICVIGSPVNEEAVKELIMG